MLWGREYAASLFVFTIISILIKLPAFYYFRLYQRLWPYASIDAMLSIVAAVFVTTILLTGIAYIVYGMNLVPGERLPRSISLIDGLLTLIVVSGSRFMIRTSTYYKSRLHKNSQARRVLIAGAGDAGQIMAREIFSSSHVSMSLVGFVDDDPDKIGATIHGVQVLGSLNQIPALVEEYRIQEVIIAMPTAPGMVIRKVVQACEKARISSKTLPGIYELLSGDVNVSRLRDVEITDLLRRALVKAEIGKVVQLLAGKRVMVTGAGGSIGSELCSQIIGCQPAQLVAVGHGENSLYALKSQLQGKDKLDLNVDFVVADVRDRHRLENIFSRFQPQIVFHAAAHKHVPLMEANLEDAVTNNILGTRNVVELSRDFAVERFLLI